jgi:hypothetical protein
VPRPSIEPTPSGSLSAGPTDLPTDSTLPTGTGSPAPSFAEAYATACNGYPSGDQVIALLRRTGGLLSGTSAVTVTSGPLCAGTWQYTVLAIPKREPLAVVTQGTPRQLTLVTAGTDVCSIPVRTGAPAGILNAALCQPPGSWPAAKADPLPRLTRCQGWPAVKAGPPASKPTCPDAAL